MIVKSGITVGLDFEITLDLFQNLRVPPQNPIQVTTSEQPYSEKPPSQCTTVIQPPRKGIRPHPNKRRFHPEILPRPGIFRNRSLPILYKWVTPFPGSRKARDERGRSNERRLGLTGPRSSRGFLEPRKGIRRPLPKEMSGFDPTPTNSTLL